MPLQRFRHIFFDLDRTLWDYETNCRLAMEEIFARLLKEDLTCGFDHFYKLFQRENHNLWGLFAENRISKEQLRRERFRITLKKLNFHDEQLADRVEEAFISEMPSKNQLFPGTEEMLDLLHGKYKLHVLTNGFDEVQENKLKHSGIRHYFSHVITSDMAGFRKPSANMFEFALEKTGAQPNNSLMIGDDPFVDVAGARNSGLAAILFNTSGIEHPFTDLQEVSSLSEIPELLHRLEQQAD